MSGRLLRGTETQDYHISFGIISECCKVVEVTINVPVCIVAKTPQALKVLLSIKPAVKQQRRIGMEVREFLISRDRRLLDFGFVF
jgi:hypothetical protein